MNTKQFRYVFVLANEGSFGRAAEVLGISQPSLSQYIKKIEEEVGMELFDRSAGNVRPTDAGYVYLDAGRKILDLEREMQGKFSDLSGGKLGTLTVGTSPYRCASMMPAAVKRFRDAHPAMLVSVEEMTAAELAEAGEAGRLDFFVSVLPVNERVFRYEKIGEEELVLAVPASHPPLTSSGVSDSGLPLVDTEVIAGQPFVMITSAQLMQKSLENLCCDFCVSVERAAVVKSLEGQIAMVRAGVGMALVPDGVRHFCTEDDVKFYAFRTQLPHREVAAIRRRDRELSRAAREFIEILKQQTR